MTTKCHKLGSLQTSFCSTFLKTGRSKIKRPVYLVSGEGLLSWKVPSYCGQTHLQNPVLTTSLAAILPPPVLCWWLVFNRGGLREHRHVVQVTNVFVAFGNEGRSLRLLEPLISREVINLCICKICKLKTWKQSESRDKKEFPKYWQPLSICLVPCLLLSGDDFML